MKKKTVVSALIFTIVVFLVVVSAFIIKTKMPSKEYMELNNYFAAKDGEVSVIMQDEQIAIPGIYADGEIYLDSELVYQYLNQRFYWDGNENKLLYTTSTAVISTEVNSKDYYVNKSKDTMDYVIVRCAGDKVYIAIDYISKYTAMEYKKYDSPDRVVIKYRYGENAKYVSAKKETQLRYEGNIKSSILVDLKENDKLLILDENINEDGFMNVMTEDGISGYVKSDKLGESIEETLTTDFKEEKYPHILLDEKVNLVWHQVTNASANSNVSTLLAATKSVNVISPTWFKTIDDNGNISSLADYTYVDRVHMAGVQIWGLCDDFDPNMKIGNVLSVTKRRQRLAKNLIAEAIKYNLDGINIDFENVRQENGKDFVQFIRELGIMCRNNGIILSIDNYPPANYSAYYNRKEQANVADYVITMAYDEYYAGSEQAGPVSSLGYVQDAVKNTLAEVPAEQTIIALPFYSRIWTEKTDNGTVTLSSEACSMGYAAQIAADSGTQSVWDEAAGMEYIEFNSEKALKKMWIENAKSLDFKMKAVADGKAGGMAFWKLGMESASIWDSIVKYTK